MDRTPRENGTANSYELQDQLDAFRQSDQARDQLVLELARRYEQIERAYREKVQDVENETQARRIWQNEAANLRAQLSGMKSAQGRDLFAVGLIDGDGAIFQDALISAASDGGSDAAHRLLTEIRKHLQEKYDEAAASWTVMVNVYCSMEGLARKLCSVGILQVPSDLQAFARAFTLNQPLFNFIDVGVGKERADHKIKESFRLFVGNSHCKHLYFGGCHDNGYLPNLDMYKHDSFNASRITLLETTPMQPGFKNLNFDTLSIPSVFRERHLPESAPPPAKITLPMRQPSANNSITSPQGFTPPSSTPAASPANTYASIGKNTATPKNIPVAAIKTPQKKAILLNHEERRLDPIIAKADRAAIERLNSRIEKKKVCNDYHLKGHCDADWCPYTHGEKLPQLELLALRNKARLRSCKAGSWCRDFECYAGHLCPHGETCYYGDTCYFYDMHGTDKNVMYKLFEDGSEETVG